MRSSDTGGCFPTGRHYPGIAHLLSLNVAGLVPGFGVETKLLDLPLVCLDTETTGRDPAEDRVIEVGLVYWREGAITERRSWLIAPGRPIPQAAFDVHGISDEDVKDAPSFAEVAPELLRALEGYVPVAYNAEFDRNMLHAELDRCGLPMDQRAPAGRPETVWLDPLVWARHLQSRERSRALGEVAARLGITLERAHRATDDAEAALLVLTHFCRQEASVPEGYGAFVREQQRLARSQQDAWRFRR